MGDMWTEGYGFVNDSTAEDPQQVTGSVSVSGDDKAKNVAHVSVSQVAKLTRPNEGLIIHGKKVYHIHLVAYVYEVVDINQQKIHLMVDDHSGGGPLEVSHIINDSGTPGEDASLSMFQDHPADSSSERPRDIHDIRVGDYISCVGVVKFTQDKANVVAYGLSIVEDPNEITLHIMQVIRDSFFYQKLQASGGVMPTIREEPKAPAQNFNQRDFAKNEFGSLSTRSKLIVNFIRSKSGDKGLHIDEIVKGFPTFNREELLKALSDLSNEGICWQSDDEDVWCVG